jgi:16S rRNA (adenine1518-N6/adenine1519-N6)-dimethyltransferase
LVPHTELPHPVQSVERLQLVVRTAFNQRRKTLRNALQSLLSAAQIEALGIDAGARPETLPLAAFVKLADSLNG